MDKNDNLSLHRALRSMQAVLSNGYQLYAQNFVCLVRSSWIQAMVYALAVGTSMTCLFTRLLPALLSPLGPSASTWAVWLATVLLFVVAAILFAFAGGVAPLYEHARTDAISMPRRWWGRWPWWQTLKGFIVLPRMLWQAVRRGQLATLVVVGLVMLLVATVATAFFQLPAVILATANVQAQIGHAAGDAVDLPGNIWLINFATFSACGLLQAFIHLSTLFPLYYVWGNACAGGNEKRKKRSH